MEGGMDKLAIIGAGAWGTALAVTARRAGREVVLWAREAEVARAINAGRENTAFLPGVQLPPGVVATTDLADAAVADAIFLVTPAQHLRQVAGRLAAHWRAGTPAVVCAKGVEGGTLALMTEVVAEALPGAVPAVLSGPTFAIEVARGLPTAVTLACADRALGEALVGAIGTQTFRPYLADDLVGVQVGGAVKNVLAIACGIVEGCALGDNARAALVTRGLAEMMRLAAAKGGRRETLMGLSGLGDLILTANSHQSRNYSLGVALGRGETLGAILGKRASVTEGVASAASVAALARRLTVDMPICFAVDSLLHHGASLSATIAGLLARPFKNETTDSTI
ncbi:MAG: NAD(P)-dependent glycerol-3-phosphate dehydrogenase [Rhodospirillales bacterium]|nr:NAD(P)-dependent glycerol-3-phosphate dehydrogenase [Rhodospirillales bacterium]